MSLKQAVIDLLNAQKDADVAAVASKADAMIAAVQALPEDQPADTVALLQQIRDLQAKVDSATAKIAEEDATIADDQSKIDALKAKIDQIKSILG